MRSLAKPWLLVVGPSVWLALATLSALDWLHLEWIEQLFLFAVWVAVPAGFALLARTDMGSPRSRRIWLLTQLTGAAFATVSFFQRTGIVAAALAVPWALNCVALTLDGLHRLLKHRTSNFSQICFAAGEAYLSVGAAWLIASRLGMRPVGFEEPIVLLTAVHFHFAGFLSAVFAGLADGVLSPGRFREGTRPAFVAVICGPALLAAGFVIAPRVKLMAAIVMALGEIGLAVAMIAAAIKCRLLGHGRWLVGVAGVSVIVGMALAIVWAIADYSRQPLISLDTMARVHGTLNALGFGGAGILGWVAAKPITGPALVGDALAS